MERTLAFSSSESLGSNYSLWLACYKTGMVARTLSNAKTFGKMSLSHLFKESIAVIGRFAWLDHLWLQIFISSCKTPVQGKKTVVFYGCRRDVPLGGFKFGRTPRSSQTKARSLPNLLRKFRMVITSNAGGRR